MSSLPRKGRWKPKPKAAPAPDPLAPVLTILAQLTIQEFLDEQPAEEEEDADD